MNHHSSKFIILRLFIVFGFAILFPSVYRWIGGDQWAAGKMIFVILLFCSWGIFYLLLCQAWIRSGQSLRSSSQPMSRFFGVFVFGPIQAVMAIFCMIFSASYAMTLRISSAKNLMFFSHALLKDSFDQSKRSLRSKAERNSQGEIEDFASYVENLSNKP